MGILLIGSGGVMIAALALDIVALATPGWIYTTSNATGLFQSVEGDEWKTVDPKGDAEKVAIAFLIMGGVILLCGVISSLLGGCEKDDKVLGKVEGVLSFLAGGIGQVIPKARPS